MQAGRKVKRTPTSAPVTVDHEVEEQTNIPYRGSVDHGISSRGFDYNSELTEFDPVDVEDLVTYDKINEPPTPSPVYIVAGPEQGETVHNFRTSYAAVGPTPTRIVGRHANRTKCKIANRGSRTLYFSDAPTVSDMFGFPVDPGASVDLATSHELYAMIKNYVPNQAPATATSPADTVAWSTNAPANATLARVAAPWNGSRGAIQVTATAAGYNVATPIVITSGRAGQTLYFRFKIAWNTGTTPAMYIRPWDAAGAVSNLTTITAATITNTAGWIEITGSYILPRDVTNLYFRIGSSVGALSDAYTVGDVSAALDQDPGTFLDTGIYYDNQPVSVYEEFDVTLSS
jgi:hypothetical protein